MGADKRVQRGEQTSADVSVFEIVLWTHDQFSSNQFVDVTVLRQGLKLRFRPDF
jgi:hypothetical protein